MTSVYPYRLAETLALLPMLYVKPGETIVVVMGNYAPLMATEVLRWRDTKCVLCLADVGVKDNRVKIVSELPANSAHAVLLSPEQSPPDNINRSLKMGGILNVSTGDIKKLPALSSSLRMVSGRGRPWRAHIPPALYGIIGAVGTVPTQQRSLPKETKFLSPQFLPSLFTFGKDEIPLVFGKNSV